MIIQSLHYYYERIKDNPDEEIPLFGFSREKIHFALVLSCEGELIDIWDLRIKKGNKLVPTVLTVPDGGKKTSGINPSFLWGTTGYVIGKDNKEHKDPKRPEKMFLAFKKLQHELGDNLDDQGMDVVLKFLDSWNPDNIEQSFIWKYWNDGFAGANAVFKLENERQYIHDHHTIQNKWLDYYGNTSSHTAYCLVTGKEQSIARLHPSIKGVRGAQSSGASIVSFNLNAFCSYDKKQSYNAPVSEVAAFNYTTILNYLLRQESRQKVIIGDTTVVFWAEGKTPVIGFLSEILDAKKIDDLQNTGSLSNIHFFLEAVRDGKKPNLEGTDQMKFFILGLSPNASRLSIRFWYQSTVENIVQKIGMHFRDMAIAKNHKNDPDYPSVWQIIRECAVQRKVDNIPPLLAGSLMQSIVTGISYPAMLLTSILNRIKADQSINSINYIRVSMIKAYLVRINRLKNTNKKEVTMSLDLEQKNIAYLLGRLFALLEKAQKDAIPGANTTIKDRFFGSASATPASVFPILLRRGQHHIEKSEYGSYTDKQMEEIIKDVHNFPRHLNIEDQGMFAIGYYHQKNNIYKKSDKQEG